MDNGSVSELLLGVTGGAAVGNGSDAYWDFVNNRRGPFQVEYIKVIFILLYVAVFVVCVFGNLLVIYVVLGHRKMRTATNFFLGNLAVADLCVGIFCIIPNLLLYLSPYWYLGKVMCKLLYFVQMMSYAASVNILIIISVERYFAILHPLHCKIWKRLWLLRLVIIIIWTVSALTGVPQLILRDMVTTSGLSFCIMVNVQFNRQAYITTNFVIWYAMPLCLMTLMYSRISTVLWDTSRLNQFTGNRMRNWRLQKKVTHHNPGVTYQDAGNSPSNQAQRASIGKPTCPIENEYPVGRSSSSVESFEEAVGELLENDVTCLTTKKSSHIEGFNGNSCSDTLSEKTSSLQETLNVELSNPSSLLSYKDVIPPRKGSHSNPNKLSEVTLDQNLVLNQYTGPHAEPGLKSTQDCKGALPSSSQDSSSKSIISKPAQKMPVTSSGSVSRIRLDKFIDQVCKPLTGRCPLQKGDTALMARRRVIRLLMFVIACFAVCVLPYHLQMLFNEWSKTEPSFVEELISPITFLIFYSNSALNPILYAFLSENFRKSLRELLVNKGCCRRQMYGQPPLFNNLTSRPTRPT